MNNSFLVCREILDSFFFTETLHCSTDIHICDRHGYSVSASHQLMSFNGHKKSCRRVRFNADGSQLVTASKDKSIQVIDMGAGSVSAKIKDAHEYVIVNCPLFKISVVGLL